MGIKFLGTILAIFKDDCKLISIWKAAQSLNRCQKGDNHVKLLTILTHDIPRLSLVFALHIMSTLFYRNWERVTSTVGYFFLWWAVLHHFRIIPLLGKNQLAPQGIFKLFQFLYRITPRILYENHGNSWNRLKPWKSPHARKGDTRRGERKIRDYR